MSWYEVKVGVGLGDLRFGATRSEVRSYLGAPHEVEHVTHPLYEYEEWRYGPLLSATFDREDDFVLGGLQISHPAASLRGVHLLGRSLEELKAAGTKLGLGDSEEEDYAITQLLAFPDSELNAWFVDGLCESLQWSYRFAEDGETVLWPGRAGGVPSAWPPGRERR